jgi:hypothetical protein
MSAIPSRGLGALPAGLLSPTGPTETPPVVDHAATEQAEQPRRQTRRRRVTGEKVLKVTLPAALAERVQLAAIVRGVRQSALVAELLDRHLPKLAIRQQG